MMPSRALTIEAAVTLNEQPVIAEAAESLALALSQADGQSWTCTPHFHRDAAALKQVGDRSVILVTSLLQWLTQLETPWPAIEQSVRSTYAALSMLGQPVMMLTILRHVEPEASRAHAEQIRIRIRRLNLLATELSRELGAFVVDLDRVLADRGARRLQTDYRLGGGLAREVASKALALCIIANTLDDAAPVDVQTRAHEIIAKHLSTGDVPLGATSNHLWTVGQGVRRQTASMTETARANALRWLLQQVLKGQIHPRDALLKVLHKIRESGLRNSAQRFTGAVKRLARSRP